MGYHKLFDWEKTQKLPSEHFTVNRTIIKPGDTVDTFN